MTIQRAITVVHLILIALGAYFTAGLVYQFTGMRETPVQAGPSETQAEKEQAVITNRPFEHYKPILDRDLFKTQKDPEKPKDKEDINLENLDVTNLNLKLWGTVSGDETEQGYAVIEDTQIRTQGLYRIGSAIQQATVKAILREKVVLSVNGKDEILAMEKLEQSGKGGGNLRPTPMQRAAFETPTGEGDRPPARTQRVSLRRSMINDAMQDVSKLMTEIAIKPHVQDGQAAGLALTNIKPNSIFRRMGLRNGDVLTGVDGQAIRSVDDALKLYENLKSADSVNVQIQRRGQDRNINYNIR